MDHAIGGHDVNFSNRLLIDIHHVVFLGEKETTIVEHQARLPYPFLNLANVY